MLDTFRPGLEPTPLAFPDAETSQEASARFEREALPQMKSLYATACRTTRNAADAEDLVQETYYRAFRAFDGYTPGTNIRAWLFTILYRVRADAYRKARRSPQTVELRYEGPAQDAPQDALARGQEDIVRALERVPETFRTAVILRDVQDFSYEEIARITDTPVGTVMSRIHRGRTRLRLLFEPLRRTGGEAHRA